MSSRLFVTRVVDKAKVIKHWYAKPWISKPSGYERETTSQFEVYKILISRILFKVICIQIY